VEERGWAAYDVGGSEVHAGADEAAIIEDVAGEKLENV
jgi:hypothetical protein